MEWNEFSDRSIASIASAHDDDARARWNVDRWNEHRVKKTRVFGLDPSSKNQRREEEAKKQRITIMGKWMDDDGAQPAAGAGYAPYAGGAAAAGACRNCGELGHYARNCPQRQAGRGADRCNRCGQIGHWASECALPDARGGGGFRGGARPTDRCSRCGGFGHYQRDCPSPFAANAGVGGPGRDGSCRICGRFGHFARDCREAGRGASRGYGADGPRGRNNERREKKQPGPEDVCNRCGEKGHWASQCSQPDNRPEGERGGAKASDKCRRCGEAGHFARDCPQPPDNTCRICKQEGHFARDCPNKEEAAKDQAANMDADLDNYMKEGAKAKEDGEA